MKALIQRVNFAQVSIKNSSKPNHIIGQIDSGILAYIGIAQQDTLQSAQQLIDKILNYRLFENEATGKMDNSLIQVQGGLLLVSQFTLVADTKNGKRASFSPAMDKNQAEALFAQLVQYAQTQHTNVATGCFGATMGVLAQNDGPINFLLEV